MGDRSDDYIQLPNGGRALRCKATLKNGKRCSNPARKGFEVCWKHGAGSGKREKEGTRKPPGRPPVHGLYSKHGLTSIRELRDQLLELGGELDNTDAALATLKATLEWLLSLADNQKDKAEKFEKLADTLAAAASEARSYGDVETAVELGRDVRAALRLATELSSWTDRLVEAALKVINAVKQRAETRAKLAETRALEQFVKLAAGVRDIVWDLMDEETLNVFEDRLRRELLAPKRLQLPERTQD
ncbi:hypothetical protein [Oceanithermus sp.]|uniref:hypothetical protein n=1 Tax=Oceanithermus sp. TaxID=2268145 RepID=UPI00257CE561|nr:hypothetical protein [Oceanithermus sp.]